MSDNTPLVSICCLTFNHEQFIRQCLDGFLMQQTTFPIEILIHDDASTDHTETILREYEKQYPDKVFPLYETQNKYQQGYGGRMDIEFNYKRARGKYIAYCEGDDYWTDPHKLQKQVDFMETPPDYSVCFHRCQHLNTYTGQLSADHCGPYFAHGEEAVDISLEMFFEQWITQPLTMMFRRSSFTPQWQKQYKHYRDMHEIYHLLTVGKGRLFSFVGGVYRYHAGGVNSMITARQYCENSYLIDREFYQINRTPLAKKNYLNTLASCITYYAKHNTARAIQMTWRHLITSHDLHAFAKFALFIIKQFKCHRSPSPNK